MQYIFFHIYVYSGVYFKDTIYIYPILTRNIRTFCIIIFRFFFFFSGQSGVIFFPSRYYFRPTSCPVPSES